MEGNKYSEGKTINEINIQKLREVDRGANGRDRILALPYSRSNWVNQHLTLLFSAPKPNKTMV